MKRDIKFRFAVILSVIWLLILTNLAFSTQETLDEIKAAIKASGAKWTPKESWVTRLSPEGFRKLLGAGAKSVHPQILGFEPPAVVMELPTSVDWRNREGHNWVTSIKNQGEGCASCVAFAMLAAMESRIAIENNRPGEDINLSEMHLFNCGGGDCTSGWNNNDAIWYLWNYGVPDEVCWPYLPENMDCSNTCANWQLRRAHLNAAGICSFNGEYYCKYFLFNSPIVAKMAVYSDFEWYGGGIYEPLPSAKFVGYHSVCIVGYNDSEYMPYWIVKNSWGEDWGVDGFSYIKMETCGIEYGCGEGNWAFYYVTLPAVPTAPSNLNASAISYNQVNLSWDDISNNEIGYEIHRKKAGGVFSLIATLGENANSYVDNTGLEEGTLYYYQVKPYNIGGKSSSEKSVTTILRAPTNLDATVISSTAICVTWNDNSTTEDGFQIWEKKGSGSWIQKSTVGANVTAKDITGLEEGTEYSYKVRAYNSYTNSDWSNIDSATTPWTQPAAPSNLNAWPVVDHISLSWQDNSNNETGFQVWRKEAGQADFSYLKSVGKNVTNCDDTTAIAGITYYYKVRAYNPQYFSSFSNEASATIPSGIPAAPSNLTATGYCWDVELTWQDNSNNEDGFYIYRKTGDQYVQFDYVGPNVTTYWDIGLWCGQLWCYKVSAFNQNGNSPLSDSKCAKTQPCYYCEEGFFGIKVTPDMGVVNSGEPVTYTYKLENKGNGDLVDIELGDDKFGIIASEFTLRKGESITFTKTVVLIESTTNFAEATARYHHGDITKEVKAHACATVRVRK